MAAVETLEPGSRAGSCRPRSRRFNIQRYQGKRHVTPKSSSCDCGVPSQPLAAGQRTEALATETQAAQFNPRLQNEGTDEKVGGKIQKKVGQVEKVLED